VAVDENTEVTQLLRVVSERLEFPAGWLELNGTRFSDAESSQPLWNVPDGSVLSVFERLSTVPEPELRRRLQRTATLKRNQADDWPDQPMAKSLQSLNVAVLCPASSLRSWNCSRCANVSFSFKADEITVVEGGGPAHSAFLAVVAPDHDRQWVVISVRGTVDSLPVDWIDDVEWWQNSYPIYSNDSVVPPALRAAKVHAGFLEAWQVRILHAWFLATASVQCRAAALIMLLPWLRFCARVF
jgi:hypothetical protein